MYKLLKPSIITALSQNIVKEESLFVVLILSYRVIEPYKPIQYIRLAKCKFLTIW